MLNLTATKTEEIIIKDYLENNISETLTDKINNGVRIQRDGKELINKKTLSTFMDYACEEARKQADKGAKFACIHNDTVFSWAVHYFEEDSIEGTLYNEDGTEYKPVTPKPIVKPAAPKPELMSLFDIMDEPKPKPPEQDTDEDVFDNTPNAIPTPNKQVPEFIFKLFGDELKVEVDK
jgi:hypothetical protein